MFHVYSPSTTRENKFLGVSWMMPEGPGAQQQIILRKMEAGASVPPQSFAPILIPRQRTRVYSVELPNQLPSLSANAWRSVTQTLRAWAFTMTIEMTLHQDASLPLLHYY